MRPPDRPSICRYNTAQNTKLCIKSPYRRQSQHLGGSNRISQPCGLVTRERGRCPCNVTCPRALVSRINFIAKSFAENDLIFIARGIWEMRMGAAWHLSNCRLKYSKEQEGLTRHNLNVLMWWAGNYGKSNVSSFPIKKARIGIVQARRREPEYIHVWPMTD